MCKFITGRKVFRTIFAISCFAETGEGVEFGAQAFFAGPLRKEPLGPTLSGSQVPGHVFSTLSSNSRHTLLHSRSQSILSFLTEDSDANRCGREVVHRWNRHRHYFLRFFLRFF